MEKAEKTIDTVCIYLNELKLAAVKYCSSVKKVYDKYREVYGYVSYIVNIHKKTDWNEFAEEERIATQNAVSLVGLLYKMCQVSLVSKASSDQEINKVNHSAIDDSIKNGNAVMDAI